MCIRARLRMWKNNLKYKFQILARGYSDIEMWNINDWFIDGLLLRLKAWKEYEPNSYPPEITPETWNDILDEMIVHLEYLQHGEDDDFEAGLSWDKISRIYKTHLEEFNELWTKWWLHLWD